MYISRYWWVADLIMALALGLAIANAHDMSQLTPDMKMWFQDLRAGKGPCCTGPEGPQADARIIQDADWTATKDGHYRVFINKEWRDVPDEAVIKEPNKFGPTMVWTNNNYMSGLSIICFMPGSMT